LGLAVSAFAGGGVAGAAFAVSAFAGGGVTGVAFTVSGFAGGGVAALELGIGVRPSEGTTLGGG